MLGLELGMGRRSGGRGRDGIGKEKGRVWEGGLDDTTLGIRQVDAWFRNRDLTIKLSDIFKATSIKMVG